jgi:Tfp pilus assembly protein PilX
VRNLPEELIFLLVLGLFWLTQFVGQPQRRRAEEDIEAERAAQASSAGDRQPEQTVRPPTFLPEMAEGPKRAPLPRDRHGRAPTLAKVRRYSRTALMGNRRAVQNGMVMAAILQPCRARRPHGMD